MQLSLRHQLGWNGTLKSRELENRDCTVFGSLKVLYAVRRPIAKQPLVTMLSAVARKSHEFLFVARAMERFAAVQIILLLRFPNTGHPVSGCVSDHWVLRNFSHEPLNDSVAAGGWHTLLWLGHWSDTEQERVHTTHSSAPIVKLRQSASLEGAGMEQDKCLWRQSYACPTKPLEGLCLGH